MVGDELFVIWLYPAAVAAFHSSRNSLTLFAQTVPACAGRLAAKRGNPRLLMRLKGIIYICE
ncbi:hypothetical protein A3I42_01335 [Candidatus Uhrbacteria bacterium RIFCSPLOWO2_02_FULL_49_11]|uniref:Uncharacterized protein n=1 Tax=Candidatus Uhrbacteria bacterium RIFCSPLOWO2_02_FULL_49_11 TaxID=1802409 RepID=A0A1F7VCQ3_9BACT|nr:MAG: hypothetical protein A3I42_01335 [Candidatus Uhrbacteria bacterium RIFCSPLOWO2_02_FULL_49_11]